MCPKQGMVVGVVRVGEEKSVFVCDIEGRVRPVIGLVYKQYLSTERKPMLKLIFVVIIASSTGSQETCSRGRIASGLSRVEA